MALRSVFLALLLAAAVSACGEIRTEKAKRLPPPAYTYDGADKGPLQWGSIGLNGSWSACSEGKRQSPVDIPTTMPMYQLTPANVSYPSSLNGTTIENFVHTLEIFPPEDQEITIQLESPPGSGIMRTFKWLQAHFHTPSEHHLLEEHYPMEVHFVHKATDDSGQFAAIALFFDMNFGSPKGILAGMCPAVFQNISVASGEIGLPPLDLQQINDAVWAGPVYSYEGSLTTPPCSEVVQFYIVPEPLPLTIGIYKEFKRIMKFNARYIQTNYEGAGEQRVNQIVEAACGLDFCTCNNRSVSPVLGS